MSSDTTNRPTPEDVVARAMWGCHERAAEASHRPEHVRNLFCDANASHVMAEVALDALAEHGYVIVHPDDSDGSADIDGQTYLLFDVRTFGDTGA